MPGATPVFGIRYPLLGEAITTAVFQNEATDIEATLAALDALATQRLNRPTVAVFGNTPGVAVNVETVATWTGESRDTDNMFTLGAPTVLTVVTPGIFLVTVDASTPSSTTTLTSYRASILKNGVVQYAQTARSSQAADITLAGLVSCAAADTIQARLYWNGTGGPATIFTVVNATLVCSV
jgi:hypothetical protein